MSGEAAMCAQLAHASRRQCKFERPRLRTAAARVLRESAFSTGDASVPILKLRYGTGDSQRMNRSTVKSLTRDA